MPKEELELREHENLYPPRFVAEICGAGNSKAVFTFEGANENIESEVLLAEGMVMIATFMYNEHVETCQTL